MLNYIINNTYLKTFYKDFINKLLNYGNIKIMLDCLMGTLGYDINYLVKNPDLYIMIKKLFTTNIKTKHGFYIINVNLKFKYDLFINYVLKFNYSCEKKHKYIKADFLISKNKIFLIFKNLINFINFHENEELLKDLIQKFSNYKINFILFSHENSYSIINTINKKKIFDITFIDCLQDYVINHPIDYRLIRFLNLKNTGNTNVPINNNFNYINNMSNNTKKINLNTYPKQNIKEHLTSKLFNQDEIINLILFSINRLKTKKNEDKKPIGSWLLCGPSGSGKTELAKILTYSLFSSYSNLIKIDMSEYMESSSSSKLIGSPPGYSGYGEETILSKYFKNNSSFVVLFDEIEKADKSIFNLMLQLLDEGRITLSNGTVLKFNKSFIIFTSNIGYSNELKTESIDNRYILNKINEFFRIEFLNRLNNIVIFNPINFKGHNQIFNKFIKELSFKFMFNINLINSLKFDFIKYSHDILYGSRPLKRYIENIFYKTNYYKTYYNNNNYKINYINNFYKYYLLNKKLCPIIFNK